MSQTSPFSSSLRGPRASQSGSQRCPSTQNSSNNWNRVSSQGFNFVASKNVPCQRFTTQSNDVREIKDIIKDVEESIMKSAKDVAVLKNQFGVEDKSIHAKLVEQMRSIIGLNARLDSEVTAYEVSLHEFEETWHRIQNHDDQEEDQMREVEQAREHELSGNPGNDDDENQSDSDEEDVDMNDDPMDGSRQSRRGRANKERIQPKKVSSKKLNKIDEAILEGTRDLFGERIASIKGPTKAAITKNPRLKELQRLLQGDDSSLFPDEDIQADEVETVPLDPFTNKKIRNPVKNKTCGHVYDKRGVFAYIQSRTGTKTRPRCPTIGCSNKHLRKEDLEEDDDMRRRIDRNRALNGEEDDSEEEEIEINPATINQDDSGELDPADDESD